MKKVKVMSPYVFWKDEQLLYLLLVKLTYSCGKSEESTFPEADIKLD